MPKITGTAADQIAQMKEQYSVRDRERDERHKDEVRELREAHREEIDKVRTQARKQIEDLQNDNGSKLNQRDIQNQKEIDALRSLYAKQKAAK